MREPALGHGSRPRALSEVEGGETDHVGMPVKGLYLSEELAVVAEGDEDLRP